MVVTGGSIISESNLQNQSLEPMYNHMISIDNILGNLKV